MTKTAPEYEQVTTSHFSKLIEEHGDNVRAVDWGSEEGQKQRFDVLRDIGVTSDDSVLDIGCGRGDMYAYLQSLQYTGKYHGVDITPGMVEMATKRFPEGNFEHRDVLSSPFDENEFDYVLASGIFYLKITDNQGFFKDMVECLYKICAKGLAFNCLSTQTSNKETNEFYFDSAEVLNICLKLSPFATLRHDYKSNDFTVYLYKRA